MIGVQCHWWLVEERSEHPRVHFKFLRLMFLWQNLPQIQNFQFYVHFRLKGESKQGLCGSSVKTVKFIPGTWQQQITCTFLGPNIKTNPVAGWGGLSKKSNIKTSKECPKLVVMHNILIVKKSNSWSIGELLTQLLMIDSSEWCVHGDISEDHKSAIKSELSQLGQDYLNYLWFDTTYPSTHPSNQPIHP